MGIIFHPGDTLEYLNEYGKKEPLIRVIDLHRHFQMGSETVHALDGVTLTAAEGEFLGVMGPSGSGKSTLLHLLGGWIGPSRALSWCAAGTSPPWTRTPWPKYRRRMVGFVFQTFNLIPTMTALQNVGFPMTSDPKGLRDLQAQEP